MGRFLFSSHDGFGLGHVRRNLLIARSVLRRDPSAEVTLITGVALKPSWLDDARITVVSVPPLLKDGTGAYRHESLPFEEAIGRRAKVFSAVVREFAPDTIVVDRHPFGIAEELRTGLELARSRGLRIVLGLRDVLDEPNRIRQEMAGQGWAGVGDIYDEALIYGGPELCNHALEYGLTLRHRYCGWVADAPPAAQHDPNLLVVSAGGGGDGDDVFRFGIEVLRALPQHRGVLIAGPYAAAPPDNDLADRIEIVRNAPGCAAWFAQAGAVLQMAGYNSTFEALAAGTRPILTPRRNPRREQAIRATRLASLGLADVVDLGAAPGEVAWLVDRDRSLAAVDVAAAGIRLDGAERAAAYLVASADKAPTNRACIDRSPTDWVGAE